MATYKFKCLKCEKVDEHRLSMHTVSYTLKLPCSSCGVTTLQTQKIGKSPVHFKGSGWPDGRNV